MTVRAKTLVKDKFWIVEQNGQKLGTLQKQQDNGWIFLSKQQNKEVFHTQESLFTKFGFGMFDESNIKVEETQTDNFDVHGFPVPNTRTIQCLMYKKNCPCTQKHQKAKVNLRQDIISYVLKRVGEKHTVLR